ncbi:MAG: bifunctional phosphoglucose/phosphomannose isomerase [Dehalococcoidia bacterium]|nr:bifunctional phosphoglucose/phosphomannose isomerase [Dehalococcoidia bacterium]
MQSPEPNTEEVATDAGALDGPATVERLDPHGLLGRIEALPEQCADARRRWAGLELPASLRQTDHVAVLGMGGSAIAGSILRALASSAGRKPVDVVRGYDLPPFVGARTLVVACSHSGNTEETLSAFRQALDSGAQAVAVTTGGRLAELAQHAGCPMLNYRYDGEPRSALGCQLMALLAVGERTGLLASQDSAAAEAVALMREERERIGYAAPVKGNPAKQLALRLRGRLPVVVGAGMLSAAAYRWKTQFNENSECWALHEELPELDHNTVVGFGLPEDLVPRLRVVFLRHEGLHPRVLLRYDATAEALSEAGVSHETVEVRGESPLAQALHAVYLGDFVSYYLALLYGVEPSPVAALERLKEKLAGR